MLVFDVLDKVVDWFFEGDFYCKDYCLIWCVIIELVNKGMFCDVVILGDWFEVNGLVEMVGGVSYLVELVNIMFSVVNIGVYGDIVCEKLILWQLIDVGVLISEDGYWFEGKGVQEVLESVEQCVFKIVELGICGKKDLVLMCEVVKDVFCLLYECYQNKGQFIGIFIGFNDLDEFILGLQLLDLIIVVVCLLMGKIVFLVNIVEVVVLCGKKVVVIFLMEMFVLQLVL